MSVTSIPSSYPNLIPSWCLRFGVGESEVRLSLRAQAKAYTEAIRSCADTLRWQHAPRTGRIEVGGRERFSFLGKKKDEHVLLGRIRIRYNQFQSDRKREGERGRGKVTYEGSTESWLHSWSFPRCMFSSTSSLHLGGMLGLRYFEVHRYL